MGIFKKFKKAMKILEEEGLGIFLSKTIKFLELRLHLLYIRVFFLKKKKIISELKNFCSDNPSNIFDFISQKYFGIFRPIQIKEEFIQLLKILKERQPKVILEIGTANGGTLFLFTRIASENAVIISVDLPGGKFGGGYPKWREVLYKSFALPNQKIHLLRMDSHKKETLEKVKNILGDPKIDFLFIDGDHTYEGVKKDFEMYTSLVDKKGIIALHDIVIHPLETGCEVNRFWKEIKNNFRSQEFVKDWNQGGYGIGMIIK